jgi:hypothetical protein
MIANENHRSRKALKSGNNPRENQKSNKMSNSVSRANAAAGWSENTNPAAKATFESTFGG